jgi:hypothetical protein
MNYFQLGSSSIAPICSINTLRVPVRIVSLHKYLSFSYDMVLAFTLQSVRERHAIYSVQYIRGRGEIIAQGGSSISLQNLDRGRSLKNGMEAKDTVSFL